jgi:hypothetical protein
VLRNDHAGHALDVGGNEDFHSGAPVQRLSRHIRAIPISRELAGCCTLLACQAPPRAQWAARNRAIADARTQLAAATSRRLNRAAIIRIDTLLGLPATDPRPGVE